MMICPETFYEMYLKGKNATQIMTVIRGLKQKIGMLKSFMESPAYADAVKICPSEDVRIACSREYLERAKLALEEAGGTYVSSAAEKKAMAFDESIPCINKVEFSIGGYFDGYETRTVTIDGDHIQTSIEPSLLRDPADVDDEFKEMNKADFLSSLRELHIGEWRRRYDSEILDGTQWELTIYFSDGRKPVKIYGSNAYPYNFNRLTSLFGIYDRYI